MLKEKTEIRVRYSDTDQMKFVYNGKYLEYFEVARTEMLRNNGLPYSEIEQKGFQLPVIEAFVKYINPGCYDDLLIIESILTDFPFLKIHIDYKIFKKTNNLLLAEGFTKHVFINTGTKKVIRPPQFFLKKIREFFPEIEMKIEK
jgi:acyl-CoA thioester hydrolase